MALVADVIVPLAAPKAYTYLIPEDLIPLVEAGKRVEVQFGRTKVYSGIVRQIKEEVAVSKLKPILHVLDDLPIVSEENMIFWEWIAKYYMCTPGEVMLAALPGALKMSSETVLVYTKKELPHQESMSDDAYLIAEALQIQHKLRIADVQQILNRKSVQPVIQELIALNQANLEEEMHQKYKPKKKQYVHLSPDYREADKLNEIFEKTARSEKQTRLLLSYFQLAKTQAEISKEELIKHSNTDATSLKALSDKGLIMISERTISRAGSAILENPELSPMSDFQLEALNHILKLFKEGKPCLLKGITGSGKTRIYQELISKVLDKNGQILFLLPEISLTTQMEIRLKELYGPGLLVYHSRMNANTKVDIWKRVKAGHQLIVGARSALLLPFTNLQLIIVDEEHDPSYKQQDPAPRYHCRDAAIYLATQFKANIILGSATPSLESIYSARSGKFGFVEMSERYGASILPLIKLVDMADARKRLQTASIFSLVLLEAIEKTINKGDKVLLFQNRRGFSPVIECELCHWRQECIHCDVTLTLHKYFNSMKCHYCGYQTKIPSECPACGSTQLKLKGFGTEKIEEELKAFLPSAKVARLDTDTAKTKLKLEAILEEFDTGHVDILVGTQMISKGLDFENVGLVGVLDADQSLHYPDFRSGERTFQLITQVSGRSGRRDKQGIVLIQASQVNHPVIREILDQDFDGHYERELRERYQFFYPPYSKLILITCKHKDAKKVENAAQILAKGLKARLGDGLLGPAPASIPRVNNQFIQQIMLKLEKKSNTLLATKELIHKGIHHIHSLKNMSTVRIVVDVDPI